MGDYCPIWVVHELTSIAIYIKGFDKHTYPGDHHHLYRGSVYDCRYLTPVVILLVHDQVLRLSDVLSLTIFLCHSRSLLVSSFLNPGPCQSIV